MKILFLPVCIFLAGFASYSGLAQQSSSPPQALELRGAVQDVHDPSIIRDGRTWYVFSTSNGRELEGQIPVRCSEDLHTWQKCGYALSEIPLWIKQESPETRALWAPDISYFNGEYHLYYAFSIFGKNTSGIALLTNKTLNSKSPDFHWVDRGLVLRSRAEDDFNAIDPNLILDEKGRAWLAFGSFWGGIKMRRIDAQTGLLSSEDTRLYSLARRRRPENPAPDRPGLPNDWQAIEAPFIVHHDDYYYLFVSFDLCCRGIKSTYRIVVGRSHDVIGPYVDTEGSPMMDGGGTTSLQGNKRWLGPGGESVLKQGDVDLIVFHAYDSASGQPSLQISTIAWTQGWPKIALRIEDAAGKSGK